MDLITACNTILSQLREVVQNLDQKIYTCPQEILSGSSVGQHVRHVIEFFECLNKGYLREEVNYDHRDRNKDIEDFSAIAILHLNNILNEIKVKNINKIMSLAVSYNLSGEEKNIHIQTTYERELAYNIEHAIHHMAIIKIGIRNQIPDFIFPSDFGVAYSTIRHQQGTCAQ